MFFSKNYMNKRTIYSVILVVIVAGIVPSYIRVYRVAGYSDVPSYLVNDKIIVNRAAYDIRIPFLDIVILTYSHPQNGDVVQFQLPENKETVFKRVIGSPGDTVSMQDNHIIINGQELSYEKINEFKNEWLNNKNHLGLVVESEAGNGETHLITFSPGHSLYGSFEPVTIPKGFYYVMGDNRDNSEDSRMYGPISRACIIGMVYQPFRTCK